MHSLEFIQQSPPTMHTYNELPYVVSTKEKQKRMREFIIIASVISVIICVASYVLGVQRPEGEKASVYQCGFVPFVDAQQRFEVRFYLVAILFLIFDLEIALLFP